MTFGKGSVELEHVGSCWFGVLLLVNSLSLGVNFMETTGLNPSAISNLDNVATVRYGALASDLPLSL